MNIAAPIKSPVSEDECFRRFGELGPAYEVLEILDDVARIRVLESGETLGYSVDRMREDPLA